MRRDSELGKRRAETASLLAFPQPEVKEAPVGSVALGSGIIGFVSLGRIPASLSQCRCEAKYKQEQVWLFLLAPRRPSRQRSTEMKRLGGEDKIRSGQKQARLDVRTL